MKMHKQSLSYTTFSHGEIEPSLFGRGDFSEYLGSAMLVRNMRARQTGGIQRRAGTMFAGVLPAAAKLVALDTAAGRHLAAISGEGIGIYNSAGAAVATLESPWSEEQLGSIRHAQKGSELYLVHREVRPKILSRTAEGVFNLVDAPFEVPPFVDANKSETKSLWLDGDGRLVDIRSNFEYFSPGMKGSVIRVNGGAFKIMTVYAPDYAVGAVIVKPRSTDPDHTFGEAAFDDARGWPGAIAFYQNRLVLGGNDRHPNRIWFSKTSQHDNFSLGTGLDDEAIEFDMLSDSANEICDIFAGRHLQIFTTDGEWMAGGTLTPTSISLREQTRIGSKLSPAAAPKLVEGSTIFVGKSGCELREFYYGETEGGYASADLASLSPHLLSSPKEIEYSARERTIYALNDDGSIAALVLNKALGVCAWSKYTTDGEFESVAALGGRVFAAVKRGEEHFLEYFDDDAWADSARKISLAVPAESTGGFGHLEGREVAINADSRISTGVVENGEITLPQASRNIMAGLPFRHVYAPLPVFVGRSRPPRAARLLELIVRVKDSPIAEIDAGGGIVAHTGERFTEANLFERPLPLFSGDIKIRAKGFVRGFDTPLFKIEGSRPARLKILNISTTIETIR